MNLKGVLQHIQHAKDKRSYSRPFQGSDCDLDGDYELIWRFNGIGCDLAVFIEKIQLENLVLITTGFHTLIDLLV